LTLPRVLGHKTSSEPDDWLEHPAAGYKRASREGNQHENGDWTMSIRFDGKVAIVTGAGGGLGRAHALKFAELGAQVVVNDLGGAVDGTGGSSEAAQKVVAEIESKGGKAIANGSSVTDRKGVENLVRQTLDAFGRIDILINNAGILRDKTFAKVTLDDFEIVVDVHLMGAVYCSKAVWPVMQEQNYGRIVMTTSASGMYGNFGQSNYGAAKLGMVGLMNVLKQEGQKNNIRVNTIAPIAATRMTQNLMPPEVLEVLKPELVTPAVVYLSSEDAPTGEIISAGGGFYARAHMVESEGVALQGNVTPDMIAENWDRIADMSSSREYQNANEETGYAFKRIRGSVKAAS
jgi:NAD(P)-dependent dehydrogenase (short-subunit alcohol dehydrogenase family)